ncbi:MAG: hypothetical protein AB8G17_20060, partial [Gammaproteobacteria bacterium]
MSRSIKEQIRVLVKEHERGLLPTDDYRRLRRALLQRAARGDFTAPEEPTATRPRRPKEAVSAPPPAAVEAPVAESKSTQTRPRATQAKPAPAVEKAGPVGAKPPKKGSIGLWLGAAVVGPLAIAAFVFLRPASAPESDAGPGAPAAVIV